MGASTNAGDFAQAEVDYVRSNECCSIDSKHCWPACRHVYTRMVGKVVCQTQILLEMPLRCSHTFRVLPMSASKLVPPELIWLSYLIQLVLVANATAAIMPLLRKKDLIEDIPLTPKQRQLLDLPPMSRSATPQEQAAYVTPPRYSRNTTPNLTDSMLVNARSTPLSDRYSPLNSEIAATSSLVKRRNSNGSSFTPSSTRRISDISLRRDSYGTPRSSPQALNELEGIVPPVKGGRTSIGLNSKWLYDKSKDNPTSAAFQGPGWGTGSVFN